MLAATLTGRLAGPSAALSPPQQRPANAVAASAKKPVLLVSKWHGSVQLMAAVRVAGSSGGGDKGVEPSIADGEGEEFSMSEVSAKTGGSSQEGPPQDGHYHVTDDAVVDGADVAADPKVNASWGCLEEPEAASPSDAASPSSNQSAPHMPMYQGDPPKEGEGYLEPGQDIPSALPGGDTGDYGLGQDKA